MKDWFFAIFVMIGSYGCTHLHTYPPSFEGKPFERASSANSVSINNLPLAELAIGLQEQIGTTGMVVLHKNRVVFEYGDTSQVSILASCRKSVLSMLYGNHVADGTIKLHDKISHLGISENGGLLSSEENATVKDILASRSGVFHKAANGGDDRDNFLERGSVAPGEYFVYNNWDFNVAGEILETKTGRSVYEELESQLAIPLGFQDWNIKNQRKHRREKKSQYPAYHMYLSTRDMAKIGQLMLNSGAWNGEQLVPQAWIDQITSVASNVDEVNERLGKTRSSEIQFSYGYMWWLIDTMKGNPAAENSYTAYGHGGQWISVFPKVEVVIAHKSKMGWFASLGSKSNELDSVAYWEFVDQLLNAIAVDLPPNG